MVRDNATKKPSFSTFAGQHLCARSRDIWYVRNSVPLLNPRWCTLSPSRRMARVYADAPCCGTADCTIAQIKINRCSSTTQPSCRTCALSTLSPIILVLTSARGHAAWTLCSSIPNTLPLAVGRGCGSRRRTLSETLCLGVALAVTQRAHAPVSL